MQAIFSYIQDFIKNTDKWLLLFCMGFAALLVTINYKFGIETKWLYNLPTRLTKFAGFYLVYSVAFIVPFVLLLFLKQQLFLLPTTFWVLLIIAPAIFAAKVSAGGWAQLIHLANIDRARFYAILVNLPSRFIIVFIPLLFFYWLNRQQTSFWGITLTGFDWRPYLLMLLIMVPLIAFASTQADFLKAYPKLQQVDFIASKSSHSWLYKLLFEFSYGIDFITIELFFRGFLVFAFVRYVGIDAILPMAVFYCSIHFGKPVFECISSFFGGLLLGIIAYRTQSIIGGIMIHLGIAWMMEAGAYIGHLYKK